MSEKLTWEPVGEEKMAESLAVLKSMRTDSVPGFPPTGRAQFLNLTSRHFHSYLPVCGPYEFSNFASKE